MPVYCVTVTKSSSVTDEVVVQASSEEEAVRVAEEQAVMFDYDSEDTSIDSVTELSADQALERSNEVLNV